MIHPDEEVAKQLSLEWDEPTGSDQNVQDIGLSQVVGDEPLGSEQLSLYEDDDFLAGVSACGMSPEECEACT